MRQPAAQYQRVVSTPFSPDLTGPRLVIYAARNVGLLTVGPPRIHELASLFQRVAAPISGLDSRAAAASLRAVRRPGPIEPLNQRFLSRIARNRASRAPTFGFAANIGAVEILQANMHGAPLQSCSAGKVPSQGMRHIAVPRGKHTGIA